MATTSVSQIKISDDVFQSYKEAAIKWNKVLLDLPIASANDVLQYMRGVTGLRGKMRFGSVSAASQFGPYDATRVSKSDVNIAFRTLETFFGSVIETFDPNDYAMLTMGYNGTTLGEGLKKVPTAVLVLSQLAKSRGQFLAQAVFDGVRNEAGTTTKDLFDGFNTIAAAEETAGNISADKGNLFTTTKEFDDTDACDMAKEIVRAANPYLRRTKCNLLCSPDFYDCYMESYLATHSGIIYNTQYKQTIVEGTDGNVTLVPLAQLADSKKFYLTPKDNLLFGTDNLSAQSTVDVIRNGHFQLSFASTIFFGVQFHSIDPRRLLVVDLYQKPANPDPNSNPG